MGCWNGTCGITFLPICSGERVRGILLADDFYKGRPLHSGGSFCYPDDLWHPIELPLIGTYDDYGGIKDIEEDGNVRRLLSMANGNEEWGSIKPGDKTRMSNTARFGGNTSSNMTAEELVYCFERAPGEIVLEIEGKELSHVLMLIREDAYLKAIEDIKEFPQSDWNPEHGTIGDRVRSEVEEAATRLVWDEDDTDFDKELAETLSSISSSRLFGFNSFAKGICNAMKKDPSVAWEAQDFLLFNTWMRLTRRAYGPPAGAGSQGTNFGLHASMAELAGHLARKMEHEETARFREDL